jgi:hypothetical protein
VLIAFGRIDIFSYFLFQSGIEHHPFHPRRTRESAPETPPVTTVIPPPPVRPTEDIPSNSSQPTSPPPDQFPLPSVEIPIMSFRPLVPVDSHRGTSDLSAEPKFTEDPVAGSDKPTSPKPTTPPPDTGKGPAHSPSPSTVTVGDAPKPKGTKLTARPKAGTDPGSRSGE